MHLQLLSIVVFASATVGYCSPLGYSAEQRYQNRDDTSKIYAQALLNLQQFGTLQDNVLVSCYTEDLSAVEQMACYQCYSSNPCRAMVQLANARRMDALYSRIQDYISQAEALVMDSADHHTKSTLGHTKLAYPVRRMRNTAVLVKWIEEHQSNPYPTKAEKQYLAYYSGMNLEQLSTWFANARRRINKIGMKTWLEGRSTFTVDIFPSSKSPTNPGMKLPYNDYQYNPSSTNPLSGYNIESNPYSLKPVVPPSSYSHGNTPWSSPLLPSDHSLMNPSTKLYNPYNRDELKSNPGSLMTPLSHNSDAWPSPLHYDQGDGKTKSSLGGLYGNDDYNLKTIPDISTNPYNLHQPTKRGIRSVRAD